MTEDAPRYADCPTVEVDILIDAPPEAVWDLVSDISLPARFSSEFLGARWAAEEPREAAPATGVCFVGRNEHPAIGTWETRCTLTDYEVSKVFGYEVESMDGPGVSSAAWRFTLTREGGGTRLTQWMRMGPGRSGLSFAIEAMPDKEVRIVARRLKEHRANMTATVTGIKELAEAAR